MKKTYVSPLAVEVAVEASQMLAASLQMNSDKTVDTSNGGQLSGGHRGEWGNLWRKFTGSTPSPQSASRQLPSGRGAV